MVGGSVLTKDCDYGYFGKSFVFCVMYYSGRIGVNTILNGSVLYVMDPFDQCNGLFIHCISVHT